MPATTAGILQSRQLTPPVERGEKGDGVELDQGCGSQGHSGRHRLVADVEKQRQSDERECRAIHVPAAGYLPKDHRVPGIDQHLFAGQAEGRQQLDQDPDGERLQRRPCPPSSISIDAPIRVISRKSIWAPGG